MLRPTAVAQLRGADQHHLSNSEGFARHGPVRAASGADVQHLFTSNSPSRFPAPGKRRETEEANGGARVGSSPGHPTLADVQHLFTSNSPSRFPAPGKRRETEEANGGARVGSSPGHPTLVDVRTALLSNAQLAHREQTAGLAGRYLLQMSGPSGSGCNVLGNSDVLVRDKVLDRSVVVKVHDRKVRLSSELDPTSLYALCRRWVRNDGPRIEQSQGWEQPPLPKPLTAAEVVNFGYEPEGNSNQKEEGELPVELSEPVDVMTEAQLLKHHVENCKRIRRRCQGDRRHRVARFRSRLALLLPSSNVISKI